MYTNRHIYLVPFDTQTWADSDTKCVWTRNITHQTSIGHGWLGAQSQKGATQIVSCLCTIIIYGTEV
jgi:hypothetical protein